MRRLLISFCLLLPLLALPALTPADADVLAPSVAEPPAADRAAVPPLDRQRVLAHRGASAYAPEHTFFAYDLAVAQDTDFLECDLQLTADGYLVCVHDTTVDRTSDGEGAVADKTLAELRQLDWGSWFDPAFAGAAIVPFEEQLDCYLQHNPRMRFHVETKSPGTYGGRMEPELIRVLAERGLVPDDAADVGSDPVLVQSFSLESLQAVKALEPRLATVFLGVPSGPGHLLGLPPAGADGISPSFAAVLADPTMPTRYHANGVEVHTYTVNDRQIMGVLLDLGVDAIFTDRPDVLREEIDRRGMGVPAEERGNPTSFTPLCEGVAGLVGRDLDGDGEDEIDGTPESYERARALRDGSRRG